MNDKENLKAEGGGSIAFLNQRFLKLLTSSTIEPRDILSIQIKLLLVGGVNGVTDLSNRPILPN